jgi:cytidyltransferase-like protein
MKKVAISGGFDPITPGHIEYMRLAKELGYLIVILNSDDFLINKKGFCLIPFEDRKNIVSAIKYVDEVVACIDKDSTVAETIKLIKPDIFAKGGDRDYSNLPLEELEACNSVDCCIICGLGEKTHSSSWYTNGNKNSKLYFYR